MARLKVAYLDQDGRLFSRGRRVDRVGFSAFCHANVAFASHSKVTFDRSEFNVGGYYDTANCQWRPPAGLVYLQAQIAFVLDSVENVVVTFDKNGTEWPDTWTRVPITGTRYDVPISLVDLATGDDVYQVHVTFHSGNIEGGPNGGTFFRGFSLL